MGSPQPTHTHTHTRQKQYTQVYKKLMHAQTCIFLLQTHSDTQRHIQARHVPAQNTNNAHVPRCLNLSDSFRQSSSLLVGLSANIYQSDKCYVFLFFFFLTLKVDFFSFLLSSLLLISKPKCFHSRCQKGCGWRA